MGLWIIVAGLVLVVVGVLVHFGLFAWFGHLPGDVRIESGSGRVFVPITSMVLISVALTVLLNVALRLFRR
jgi:hypothetical protein